MADKTWKADERKVARMFGAERNRLSGSSGRDCDSCSDSNHARLYIEAKRKKRHTVYTLYDDTAAKAKAEGKLPVVYLKEAGRQGFLVVMSSKDFDALAVERVAASDDLRRMVNDARSGMADIVGTTKTG